MKLNLPWDKRVGVYDRARSWAIACFAMGAILIVVFVGGRELGFARGETFIWIWFALAAVLIICVPRCAHCGKSPFHQRLLKPTSRFYRWYNLRLSWPEKICSECNSDLSQSAGSAHLD